MQKVLTKEIAEEWLADVSSHDLNKFTVIDDAAAEYLSKCMSDPNWPLELEGLTELSDEAAKSLSKHKSCRLELPSLTRLSDAGAKSLSKYKGSLTLDGLTELSDAAAESLSKHKGERAASGGGLFLNGLTELSNGAAESLSKHKGNHLSLNGLTKLSDEAAESLGKHKGYLDLDALTPEPSIVREMNDLAMPELSDAAIESLSKHEGEISGLEPEEWAEEFKGNQ